MRITIINSVRVCGGGEKWLARQAGCWRERGHDPLIVCQPGSGLERLAREAGLRAESARMRHDLSPAAVLGLGAVLRRERPSVVLCCNERAFRLAVPAAWCCGQPPVLYRNGLTATFKNKAVNRLLFRAVHRMIVISEALRAEMASYGWIPASRLEVIRNGIDPAIYAPDPAARARVRAELGASPQRVVAAVLARVTEDKGQVETIQALARLAGDHPEAELWIVGEGSLRGRLEELARELRVVERVRFPGFRSDVAAVLQATDIVIQASHREGLGNTLLEAMASARPIIASAVGGILDVVVPGETGELIPPHDAPALATAWASLLADPERRRHYGEQGRWRAETHFPLRGETERWLRLFEEIAARPARRAGAAPARLDSLAPPADP